MKYKSVESEERATERKSNEKCRLDDCRNRNNLNMLKE